MTDTPQTTQHDWAVQNADRLYDRVLRLEAAARDVLDDVATRANITASTDFACPKMKTLFDVLVDAL